jgi:hypothetical protein
MNSPFNPKPLLVAGAIVGSLLGGIAVGATTLAPTIASAATTTLAATASPGAGSSAAPPAMPAHGTPEHENAETAVTGDNATKAQAAAVKAVGGGTAGAVSTDFTKNGYEVAVTKSDGSTVEVHLDGNFNALPIR